MKSLKEIIKEFNFKNVEFISENFININDEINLSLRDDFYSIQTISVYKTYKTEKGLIKALKGI